jgi:RNA polymerase sigma-70 factor (ECF subfamily)
MLSDAAPSSLLSSFLSNLQPAGSRAIETYALLANDLARLVDTARLAWPSLALEPPRFVSFLASRIPTAETDMASVLGRLHGTDLFLACACIERVPGAADAFRSHVRATVEANAQRIDGTSAFFDDVERTVVNALLVTTAEHPQPGLARYRGNIPLTTWVGVSAQRTILDLRRGTGGAAPTNEAAIADHVALEPGAELSQLKVYYKDAFDSAFTSALACLTDRELVLLRLHLGARLGVAAIAHMYRTDVPTITAWIADARHALAAETQANLKRQLRASPAAFDSIVTLVPTQVDARMTQLLHGIPRLAARSRSG